MKTEYITIKRKQESKTSAKISLTTKNVDLDNPERMWYIIAEWLGSFLRDLKNSMHKDQLPLYYQYISDLKKYVVNIFKEVE